VGVAGLPLRCSHGPLLSVLASRLAVFAGLLPLVGCCLTIVPGIGPESGTSGEGSTSAAASTRGAGASTSAGESSTGTTSAASGRTSGARTSGNTGTTGGAGTTGSTTGTQSGTSAGSILPPTYFLDAGEGEIFGPVSIAGGSSHTGDPGARLVYSRGDGGQFDIFVMSLSGAGGTLLGPQLVAVASAGVMIDGGQSIAIASSPNLSVSDFGNRTGLCWEAFGSSSNPYAGCDHIPEGPTVTCATLAEIGDDPQGSYSNCDTVPQLVFNRTDRVTQLFTRDGVWWYGMDWGISLGGPEDFWSSGPFATVALSENLDGLLLQSADINPNYSPSTSAGLLLIPLLYADAPSPGYLDSTPVYFDVDPAFSPTGLFAAAASSTTHTVAAVELEDSSLRGIVWTADAGIIGAIPIQSSAPPVWPMAAATCSSGFGYLAMTGAGSMLFAEQSFDGSLMAGTSETFTLEGFSSTITSMAVAPSADGSLLLAVSSQAQIAVYLLGCQ